LPRRAWIAAIVCLVAVVVGLQRTSADLAFPRDEAIYFEASRAYGAWLDAVARSPGRALDAKARDRAFAVNHEHPPAMKLAAAVTAGLFARPPVTVPTEGLGADRRGVWPLLGESQALRLAAHLVAGVGVLLIVLAGTRRFGTVAGLVAAGAFILLPRVWFHAQLHTFDVPVTVAIFAVVLAWIRGRDDPRFGWLAGALLGLAVATKHNALFVGPLLLGHHFIALGVSSWRTRERPPLRALFPARVLASLTLAPLTFFALWPWLWRDSWARGLEWAVFHRDHAYYNTEYLGANYNEPPLPFSYPFVMTWATVPTTLLLLALLGFIALRPRRARGDARGGVSAAGPGGASTSGASTSGASTAGASTTGASTAGASTSGMDGDDHARAWRPRHLDPHEWSLLLVFALFPIVLIAHPRVPIFGGTKHWMTAYPFLALAVAAGWARCRDALDAEITHGTRLGRILSPIRVAVPALLAIAVLLPSAVTLRRGHPHLLSQYAPLVGGARGAAALGLQRGFWGYDIDELLTVAETDAALRGGVDLHDLHPLARAQLQREGRWPVDWSPTPLARARLALHFYERHTLVHEVETWNALNTTRPRHVTTLDDVPLTSLYLSD
jgi:hypothetical protein